MTRLLSFDGTTKDWDTNGRVTLWGDAYGDPAEGSTGPFTGRWEVVDDVTTPTGTGKVLRQNWQIGDGDGFKGLISQDWQIGGDNLDEVYMRYRVKFSSNWQRNTGGEKLGYWGTGNAKTDYFLNPRSAGHWGFATQEASPGADSESLYTPKDPGGNFISIPYDEWILVEIHMKANSTPSTSDGFFKWWIDGVLQDSYRSGSGVDNIDLTDGNRQWSTDTDPGFRGAQWFYWGGAGNTKSVNDWIDWGEYYVSGKVN